ncbi:MAG: CotH kinase family protein [Planctomycetes bacterium]|nr:CotH kinase family protein [Planctomycetota bacterium]
MYRFAIASVFIVAVAVGINAQQPAPARNLVAETDAFFTDGKIPNLSITVGMKEADSLRREPRKYVKATLKEGDKTYTDIAIHLRGSAGSFRNFDDRPGLTINMDKFTDGLDYRGMDKFHLANSAQDPSYLSELICGEICKAAGVPAARIGHAIVTLNTRKLGMYYFKEGYDKNFLKRNFKSSNGNFYDGGFLRDIDQPLDLISTKDDVPDRKDLKALLEAAREPDKAKRFQRLEKVLDLDEFISLCVVEIIMSDWDGYPMKPNNYRIYHDRERDKMIFIPSGMDQMFGDVNWSILPGFNAIVARALIDTPEGKKRYIARFREIMKTCYKPDDLVKKLDEAEKRVQAALVTVDANQARDLKNHVERLRSAIRQRAKIVDAQLAMYEISDGKPIDAEGFIHAWLVLSPVPHPPGVDANAAVDKQLIPDEAKLEPKENDKVKVAGKELAWTKVQTDRYFVDLSSVNGAAENATGYMVTYIVAPDEMKEVTMRIGSDDSAKVYLNGKEIGKVIAGRAVGKDQDSFGNLTLKKGVNVVVFKVSNGISEWAGAARFVDKAGAPLKGIKAQLTK